ncbi:FAD binding domain-containing protein [Kibdelosporangium lantanae]|uniref:FAD binding domain-containing protein n=1 Tax=Kibdelosporangium lantanae TaxID=1497396 RepID=A0ABW3MR57_9PSEU
MRTFAYVTAQDVPTAIQAVTTPGAKFLGGGTNLVDLMRQDIEHPTTVVDITRLPLNDVKAYDNGVRIGALVRNSHLAAHPVIRSFEPGETWRWCFVHNTAG